MSSQVVEQAGVSATLNPLVQACGQRARQQVRHREEPPLAVVEHVEVFDRLVDLAVLEIAEPIAVIALQQDANEGVKEVQVLRRGFERERVDRHLSVPQADFEIAPAEQRGQLPVAVARDRGSR